MTQESKTREQVPLALRTAIGRDFAPVAPLLAPWKRAIALVVPALAVVTAALLASFRAGDGVAAGWRTFDGIGVSLLEWAAGLGLAWLALREAVPGLGVGTVRATLAAGLGIGVQLVLGLWIWWRGGGGLSGPGALAHGSLCASVEGALGMPHLAVVAWLSLRALPLRPGGSGALAGAAAGLLADSLWHLVCKRSDLLHLLVWHLGATAAMTALGAVAGAWWFRRRVAVA